MRKIKRIFTSLSVAALLAFTAVPVYAQETETEAGTEAETLVTDEIAAPAPVSVSGDEISEADQQTLASYAEESIGMVTGMPDEQLYEILKPSSILSVPVDSVVQSAQSWLDNRDELGAFGKVLSHKLSVDDKTITIESTCEFANGEGLVTTVLDRGTLTMDSMSFSRNDDSLGKTMEEAALNTIMGLGIVFLTLLFLSFLISQFRHISKLESAMNQKAAPAAAPAPAAAETAVPAVEETVTDDSELIAVIAAAVAAYEGTTTDGFVVRSIKKSNRNKWQRA